jgi:hypothetical protein
MGPPPPPGGALAAVLTIPPSFVSWAALVMPKKAPVDKELATMLKAARRKRMHFVVVVKSPAEGKLFVSKKKVDKDSVAEAKESLGGGRSYKGTCLGVNGTLVFSVSKEPPATLAPVLQRYAKLYAGLKIKAEAILAADVGDDAPAKPKSEESRDRRAATAAVNEALTGQDEDIHRKRKLGPKTKDRAYAKNVTTPANAALMKASEELMSGGKLTTTTIKELNDVLATLGAARKEYGGKIETGSEQDQQRQRKVLAIAKREDAIKKVLAQAAKMAAPAAPASKPPAAAPPKGQSSAAPAAPAQPKSSAPNPYVTVVEDSSASDTDASEHDAKSINQSLKSVSADIARISAELSPADRKQLQQSLQQVKSLRDSLMFDAAANEITSLRDHLKEVAPAAPPADDSLEDEQRDRDVEEGPGDVLRDDSPVTKRSAYDIPGEEKDADDENPLRAPQPVPGGANNKVGDPSADDLADPAPPTVPEAPAAPPLPRKNSIPPAPPGRPKKKPGSGDPRAAATQWRNSAKTISQQVNSLQAAILKVNDDRAAQISRRLNRVTSGLPDPSRLLESLAAARETSDDAGAERIASQLEKMLAAATAYAANPLLKHVDENPFQALKVRKVLADTIDAVRDALA